METIFKRVLDRSGWRLRPNWIPIGLDIALGALEAPQLHWPEALQTPIGYFAYLNTHALAAESMANKPQPTLAAFCSCSEPLRGVYSAPNYKLNDMQNRTRTPDTYYKNILTV